MAPLVRCSWAPRGRTPKLTQRGRSRRKLSGIGALAVSPRRRRVHAYFAVLADISFDGEHIVAFLQQLCRALRQPIVLVWDRLGAHIGQPVKGWLKRNRHRIRAELLPPYAPELNPVEQIWGYAKCADLANFAPLEFHELAMRAHLSLLDIGDNPTLLRSFLRHCALSIRLT